MFLYANDIFALKTTNSGKEETLFSSVNISFPYIPVRVLVFSFTSPLFSWYHLVLIEVWNLVINLLFSSTQRPHFLLCCLSARCCPKSKVLQLSRASVMPTLSPPLKKCISGCGQLVFNSRHWSATRKRIL